MTVRNAPPPRPTPELSPPPAPPRRRTPTWKIKLAVLLFGFTFATLSAEVLVRLFGNVRNVGPSFTAYDAEYGKRLKKNYACRRISPEFEMVLHTNSLGYRGPEVTQAQRGGIVFIGDSFTMGYGVSDGEEFPQLVAKGLKERGESVPVTNMGMGHQGNARWLKFLENEVREIQPELIVFQICGNDFSDNVRENLFRLENDELVEQPISEPSFLRKLQTSLEAIPGLSYSHFISLLKQSVVAHGNGEYAPHSKKDRSPEPTPKEKLTLALIDQVLATTQEAGWPLIIMAVGVNERRGNQLAQACEARGVPLWRIPRKKARPDLYFEVDGHWSTAGHEYVAEQLLQRIENDPSLLPSSRDH